MKPYPLELRQRIVAAVDQQSHPIAEVAVMFNVSERYVYQLLKLRRDVGDLTPLPRGGGAVAKLDGPKLRKLAALVKATPDATLGELQTQLQRRCRLGVSLNTIWRGLQQLDLTRKKSPGGPVKQSPKNARPFVPNK